MIISFDGVRLARNAAMKTSEGSGSAPAPQTNLGNQGCARLQEVDDEHFPNLPSRIPALLSASLPLSFSHSGSWLSFETDIILIPYF